MKIIDESETQKKKKKKKKPTKTEKNKEGTETIVNGWELNDFDYMLLSCHVGISEWIYTL